MIFFSDFGAPSLDVTTAGEASGLGFGAPTSVQTNIGPGAAISGGLAPYSVLWEYVSGDTTLTINDAALLNPAWQAAFASAEAREAVWRITVTDAASAEVIREINVRLEVI